jgi:hypothetical protein
MEILSLIQFLLYIYFFLPYFHTLHGQIWHKHKAKVILKQKRIKKITTLQKNIVQNTQIFSGSANSSKDSFCLYFLNLLLSIVICYNFVSFFAPHWKHVIVMLLPVSRSKFYTLTEKMCIFRIRTVFWQTVSLIQSSNEDCSLYLK